MEIALVRVDERLIHGQITMNWTRRVGANVILAANDDVVKDSLQSNLMKMAAPPGTKVEILSMADAAEKISGDAWPNGKLLILVRNPIDLVYLIEHGLDIEKANVGGVRKQGADIKLTKEVMATEDELAAWKKLDELGIDLQVQWLPGEGSTNLNNVLKKF
ncbi:MAG: PTS sugar transporter subunit IIB [Anaerolineales bacterium]|jgi:mannose/fructose/N-acetylgalactosamine-specific phosphotransferase system component IIB